MRRYKFTKSEVRDRKRHRRWRRTALLLSGLLLLSAVVLTVGHARRAPSALIEPATKPTLPTPRAMDTKQLLD